MQVHSAEALVDAYNDSATKVSDALASMSSLVAEANNLLGQSSHPLYGPMPALNTIATELRTDSRDLAWRVDWIKTTDAQPLGVTGQVQAYAPTTGGPNGTFDLDAALAASGLTEEEAARAKQAILRGADFSDTITAEKQRTFNDNMAMFRRMEAESWTQVELSPLDQANQSLDEISDILDTARQDRDDGWGEKEADGIWSTNDLKAMIENEHGYYTDEQVEHARTVLAMAESSTDARDHLGISQSDDGWSFTDIAHLTLDIAGLFPVIGNGADAINAAWYAAEGDYLNAALSSLGMVPVVGQAVIAAKPAIIAASAGILFKSLDEALAFAKRWLDEAGILRQGDEAGAAVRGYEHPSGPTRGDIRYNDLGEPVSVDPNRLFGPTDTVGNPLLDDSRIQQEIADAWKDSVDLMTTSENGGWLVRNADGSHSVVRWPEGSQSQIGIPRDTPDNAVGAFHTHPNRSGVPGPSDADIRLVQRRPELAPHYVVSHEGIYVIDAGGNVTELG